MCTCSNSCRRLPNQVVFCLGNSIAFFLLDRLIVFSCFLGTLGVSAFKLVAVLEIPGALANRLVVLKVSFKVHTIRVNPSSTLNLSARPFTKHLHASLLACVGASSFLLTKTPPTRIDVTVRICKDTFSVTSAIFPIALVLTLSVVTHLANAMLAVLTPFTVVFVPVGAVTVDASSLTNSV